MATIAEKLNAVLIVKHRIASAITAAGITLPEGEENNFFTYADAIESLTSGGTVSSLKKFVLKCCDTEFSSTFYDKRNVGVKISLPDNANYSGQFDLIKYGELVSQNTTLSGYSGDTAIILFYDIENKCFVNGYNTSPGTPTKEYLLIPAFVNKTITCAVCMPIFIPMDNSDTYARGKANTALISCLKASCLVDDFTTITVGDLNQY